MTQPGSGTRDQAWSYVISDGTRSIEGSVLLPWSEPLIAVGDAVSVEYRERNYDPAEATGSLIVRKQTGQLVLWVADDIDTQQLTPPSEIQVENGKVTCSQKDDCGTWERRTLLVTANGVHEQIYPASIAEVGGLTMVYGENRWAVETHCDDALPGFVRMAAVGMDLATLNAMTLRQFAGPM